jgi:hypothetical protein
MLAFWTEGRGLIELTPTWPHAGAPTNGATFAGLAAAGDLLVDYTTKVLYQNTGTSANPTWTVVGSGNTGLSGMTAGQIPVAHDAATVASSLPLSGPTDATEVVSATSAAKTSGHLATWNANGSLVDGGAVPAANGLSGMTAAGVPIANSATTANSSKALTSPSSDTIVSTNSANPKVTGQGAFWSSDGSLSSLAAISTDSSTNVTITYPLVFTGQVSTPGAQAGTLTNAPTAGDPLMWIKLTVDIGSGPVLVELPVWAAAGA